MQRFMKNVQNSRRNNFFLCKIVKTSDLSPELNRDIYKLMYRDLDNTIRLCKMTYR